MPAGPREVGAAPWGRSHDPPVTLPPAGWAGWGQRCHEGWVWGSPQPRWGARSLWGEPSLQLECSDSSILFHLSGKELGKDGIAVNPGQSGSRGPSAGLGSELPKPLYPGTSGFWASWVRAS